MSKKKLYIETVGCQMNVLDSELVVGALRRVGYEITHEPTEADDLYADDVPEEVKKRRNNDLLAIQAKVSLEDHRRFVGSTVDVLVEGPSKNSLKANGEGSSGPIQLTGRTMTDHIVVFEGNARLIGRTLAVHIEEATPFTLFGEVRTGEQVGVEEACGCEEQGGATPAEGAGRRVGLPVV
jgi:tRNA-2-methylthio-N6-dimethylallyladenosine synthase